MKKERFFWITLIVILTLGCAFIFFNSKPKIGYINNAIVYEEFELKKELEKELENFKLNTKAKLDSLYLQMKSIEQQFNEGRIEAIELENFSNSFEKQLKYHEDELANKTSESIEQIWNQLNSYVQEFGQENGYDYILGATGDGGIMYASEAENLNEEVIAFINEKYNGK